MVPTIGRIVQYTLSDLDAAAINKRRDDAQKHMREHVEASTGVQVHVGNRVAEGEVYPLVITRVWGATETSAVNGQLLLDGNDTYWVTSASEGEGPRHFAWPVRNT